MDNFFPFPYEPQKKEQELEPLYVEIAPPLERETEEQEEKEERGVVIIQL